jgi:antitoxin component YwqK of YwqJK toxin-antitoxin module
MLAHKMSEQLVALTKYIRERYPEGKYLYKSCSTTNESWIVVLQLTDNSITNQSRLSIRYPNRKYAKFRANKLKVVDIINKFNRTKTIDSIESSVYIESKIKYVKENIVKSNFFDSNLSRVCSNGIHFFESIEPAFYYELYKLRNYTGHWINWNDNGQKIYEGYYMSGEETGLWVTWYDNGVKNSKGYYLNGKETGHWIIWYDNGQKSQTGDYLKGEKTGRWTHWSQYGKKDCECHYLNGKRSGRWIRWSRYENKKEMGGYHNDKKTGHWIFWDDDGKIKEEGNYVNGVRSGRWTYWHTSNHL